MTVQDTAAEERMAQIRDIAGHVFSVEPAAVAAATSFINDLEVDSLLAIELLAHLEHRFGVTIDDADVPRLMTDLRSAYQVVAESAGW